MLNFLYAVYSKRLQGLKMDRGVRISVSYVYHENKFQFNFSSRTCPEEKQLGGHLNSLDILLCFYGHSHLFSYNWYCHCCMAKETRRPTPEAFLLRPGFRSQPSVCLY